jgi:putative tryptophan/tyrosine transport system substrate-binding protein
MRRRELLQVFGGALAWPLAARAEQPGPVIGLVHAASASYFAQLAPSFAQGLKESGYTPGQNVAIEYRWAEGHYTACRPWRRNWLLVRSYSRYQLILS